MMHSDKSFIVIAAALVIAASGCRASAFTVPSLQPVDRSQVCVESGRLQSTPSGAFLVTTAGMRAVVGHTTGQEVEGVFTYRGPSAQTAPLASGELRRQIGLKLEAQDTCNVIYIMWHIAPNEGIFVSVKSNPGQTTHAQCADRGYINMSPTSWHDVAPLAIGQPRTLTARIDDELLRVSVDGSVAWEGVVPNVARALQGPVGIRSDNGEFDLQLSAVRGDEVCATVQGGSPP